MIEDLNHEGTEDVAGLAGWMYTDLLLGLMVIFLATITFVPQSVISNDAPKVKPKPDLTASPSTPPIKKSDNKSVQEVNFFAEFEVFNSGEFSSKLAEFRKNQGVASSSKVISAQFIGSYDPREESPSDGVDRALTFGIELDKAFPTLLRGVDSTVETYVSKQAKVLIRLTYIRK